MPNSSIDLIKKKLIQGIAHPPDQTIIFQEITKTFVTDFPADFCLIVTGIDDLNYCQFSTWFIDKPLIISHEMITQLLTQPWLEKIVKTQKIQTITNIKKKIKLINTSFLKENNLSSLLGIYTNFQNKSSGVIILGKIENYQWNQQDKNNLKELTDLVAIAGYLVQSQQEKTLSYRETSFSLSNIPKILDSNPLLKLWWETTRKQLERQLESNKQLIYNMITIMSDQTRNPLAIIKMGITMLRTKELSSEELNKRLDILETEWEKLNEINEEILKLKNLKSQQLTLSPNLLNLETLISEVITNYQNKWEVDKRKFLTLKADFSAFNQDFGEIRTDAEQLKKILQELLTNAGKFAVNNSIIRLKIETINVLNQPRIMISISNISLCSSTQNISQFFDPFYREQAVIDTAIPGIGLGLTIVKDLVALLNGTIELVCDPHDTPEYCKITFKLILPQSL